MMKKSLFGISLVLVGLAFSFESCKRGENDPSLSFKTRTARLKGDWNLVEKNVTLSSAANAGSNVLTTETINGTYNGDVENVVVNTDSIITYVRKYDFDITFDEMGTYNYTVNIYRPTGNPNAPYLNSVYVTSGVWAWLDQGKDKLGISLSNDFNPEIPDSLNPNTLLPYQVSGAYMVDRLASDELVLKRSGQFTSSIDTITNTLTFDGVFTFGR